MRLHFLLLFLFLLVLIILLLLIRLRLRRFRFRCRRRHSLVSAWPTSSRFNISPRTQISLRKRKSGRIGRRKKVGEWRRVADGRTSALATTTNRISHARNLLASAENDKTASLFGLNVALLSIWGPQLFRPIHFPLSIEFILDLDILKPAKGEFDTDTGFIRIKVNFAISRCAKEFYFHFCQSKNRSGEHSRERSIITKKLRTARENIIRIWYRGFGFIYPSSLTEGSISITCFLKTRDRSESGRTAAGVKALDLRLPSVVSIALMLPYLAHPVGVNRAYRRG